MTTAASLSARPDSPRDVADFLAQLEGDRRRQLDALPDDKMDPVAIAYRATLERIVVEVSTARQRHAAGLYGICSTCEKAIDPERLEFRPWVTMCTKCA
jgi:RNA polymerase-binding transcription factor DksA